MTETSSTPGLVYARLEGDIHEFSFLESSKAVVDSFFQALEGILAAAPPDSTLRYLVDTTRSEGGMALSLVAMTQRFRRLEAQFPQRARGRTAVLHRHGAVIAFIDELIRALAPSRDVTRFFPADRRDDALAWLLSE